MGKIMTVVSPERGAGKTTTVAALSSALAMLGYKSLCISFDTESKMLERVLCIDVPEDMFFIDDFTEADKVIELCHEHAKITGLFYIKIKSKHTNGEPGFPNLLSFFDMVRREFDFCIIDTHLEICDASNLAQLDADVTLIVATEEVSSLRLALTSAKQLHGLGIGDVQLLVNKVNPLNFKSHWEEADEIIEMIEARLVGIVLEDINIALATAEQSPLVLYRKKLAIFDFVDTARRLMGEIVPWPFLQKQPVISSISVKGVSSTLIGSYGDPEFWAKSTLDQDEGKLIKVYEIKPGKNVPLESVRNRIWLHDLLDEEKIPYKVAVSGFWASRKKYSLSQSILVEQKDRNRTRQLILEYNKNV